MTSHLPAALSQVLAEVPVGFWIDQAGALLIAVLGLWVWRVRPGAAPNRLFALMVASWGLLTIFVTNLSLHGLLPWPVGHVSASLGNTVAAGAAIAFALRFPGPMRRGIWTAYSGRWMLIATGVILQVAAWIVYVYVRRPVLYAAQGVDAAPLYRALPEGVLGDIMILTGGLLATAWFLVGTIFALRYLDTDAGATRVRISIALVTAAILIRPSTSLFYGVQQEVQFYETVDYVALAGSALLAVLVVALWLDASRVWNPRAAIAVAWTVPALALLGLVLDRFSTRTGVDLFEAFGGGGLLRIAATIMVAYAIVRHQLFDIDLKIKWTISRGALAAIFVASFFVVSELVSGLLSERVGLVAGVLITGALVFALTPLQRLADRVSSAAMPNVHDTHEYRLIRRRELYGAAVESALLDGTITDRERDMLARLADELGLTSVEARALERSIQDGHSARAR